MKATLYDKEMTGWGRENRHLTKPRIIKLRREGIRDPWYARRPGAVRKRFVTFEDALHYALTGEVR